MDSDERRYKSQSQQLSQQQQFLQSLSRQSRAFHDPAKLAGQSHPLQVQADHPSSIRPFLPLNIPQVPAALSVPMPPMSLNIPQPSRSIPNAESLRYLLGNQNVPGEAICASGSYPTMGETSSSFSQKRPFETEKITQNSSSKQCILCRAVLYKGVPHQCSQKINPVREIGLDAEHLLHKNIVTSQNSKLLHGKRMSDQTKMDASEPVEFSSPYKKFESHKNQSGDRDHPLAFQVSKGKSVPGQQADYQSSTSAASQHNAPTTSFLSSHLAAAAQLSHPAAGLMNPEVLSNIMSQPRGVPLLPSVKESQISNIINPDLAAQIRNLQKNATLASSSSSHEAEIKDVTAGFGVQDKVSRSMNSSPQHSPRASFDYRSSFDGLQQSCNDSNDSNTNNDMWESCTSFISRLSAGLTENMNSTGISTSRGCSSPSYSEDSNSFSYQQSSDSLHYKSSEDLFSCAHLELMKDTPAPVKKIENVPNVQDYAQTQAMKLKGEMEDNEGWESRRRHDQWELPAECESWEELPDINTILEGINIPDLVSHTPDKEAIGEFLQPHEIGHLNHLIKSMSDAIFSITLPDTLLKEKGFTSLDYMDLHLNHMLRHFYFIFKNEEFICLSPPDQAELMKNCSVRASACMGFYTFDGDSSSFIVPGLSSKNNHINLHISDLLEVYHSTIVRQIHKLFSAAAALDFDWPMGIICTNILMFTPVNVYIQELDKIDALRDKYVGLLLKYVKWKFGIYNASFIFPQILKLLDALLRMSDTSEALPLKYLSEDILAIEERLATFTMEAMPLKDTSDCRDSSIRLDTISLKDLQYRLCHAILGNIIQSMHEKANGDDKILSYESLYRTFESDKFSRNWVRNKSESSVSLDETPVITDEKCRNRSFDSSMDRNREISSDTNVDDTHMERNIIIGKDSERSMESGGLCETDTAKSIALLSEFVKHATNNKDSAVAASIRDHVDENQIRKLIDKLYNQN